MSPLARYHYSAFGLRIASSIALEPYLVTVPGEDADIDLLVGDGEDPERCSDESVDMEWPGLVRLHVRGGRRLWVNAHAGLSAAAVPEVVAGPALAIALAQRGRFVLHASAVALHGQAVAVSGYSGAGKSTMSAMLAAVGGRPFSDDIVPICLEGGRAEVIAGPTLAKLDELPAAVADRARLIGPEAIGRKSLYSWSHAAEPGARAPLSAILLVEDGDDVAIHRLRGHEAVAGLLRFAFCLTTGGMRRQARHLEDAGVLAARVPVSRLVRPRTFEGAARAVDLVARRLAAGWQ